MWHYKIFANNAPLMDSGKIPGHASYTSGTQATLAAESICDAIGNEYNLEIKVYSILKEEKYTLEEFKNFLKTVSEGIRIGHIHHYLTTENMARANAPQEDKDAEDTLKASYVAYVQNCNIHGDTAMSFEEYCNPETIVV